MARNPFCGGSGDGRRGKGDGRRGRGHDAWVEFSRISMWKPD